MSKIELDIHKLHHALISLEQVYLKPALVDRESIDTTIHRFEFTFELFWKTLKTLLYIQHGIDAHSPKAVLRAAYLNDFIQNEQLWLAMLEDRNSTSHTYDKAIADEVFSNIKSYVPAIRSAHDSICEMLEIDQQSL